MLPDRHGLITAVWLILNLLPLSIVIVGWTLWGAFCGIPLFVLYLFAIIPYGYFVSVPTMVRLFHKPASIHKR